MCRTLMSPLDDVHRASKKALGFLLAATLLSSCLSSDPGTTTAGSSDSGGNFSLELIGAAERDIIEGDENGVRIPLQLQRRNGHNSDVTFSVLGSTEADIEQLSGLFTPVTLSGTETNTELVLSLNIGALPIAAQTRTLTINASDSETSAAVNIVLNVEPTSAPDIYLLVGQSNMVGFSGDDTKEAFPGGLDEPNARIKQLHVTDNDEWNVFIDSAAFSDAALNIQSPSIITAEDPLHESLLPNGSGKFNSYIGMGLSFAKAALRFTTAEIVLVPAAWSGSAFCNNEGGPRGAWNAIATDNDELGNSWLFDRALVRANIAIDETGGVLRGILWHQGESDANEICAPLYTANLTAVVEQFRERITADRRGRDFRGAGAAIPFILGTMSRGFDDRGDLSMYSTEKQMIDDSHRLLPTTLPFVATSIHDDLVGSQWPCGSTDCIHFGAEAMREIGARYFSMLRQTMAASQ